MPNRLTGAVASGSVQVAVDRVGTAWRAPESAPRTRREISSVRRLAGAHQRANPAHPQTKCLQIAEVVVHIARPVERPPRPFDTGGMDAHILNASDVRHWWDNVDGQIVDGWELAVGWDRHGTATGWRPLNADNPEDQRLLADLVMTGHAPSRAA